LNRYDVVTFDMGSTLVYFHPSEAELYLRALHSLGVHIDAEVLRRVRDGVWGEYFRHAAVASYDPTPARDREIEERMAAQTLAGLGYDDPALTASYMAAAKAAFQAPGAVRVYPEVAEVLTALRAGGCRLGIISNWSWDLDDYVELVGLTGHFDAIVGSARTGCDKPHPEIFRHALGALQASPERAIHIGDSYESDVLGARGVGMGALWLDRAGRGGHDDCPAIRDLTEVLSYVQRS
jgi:HAD superfamily hydrolase (TIGR01549 family)